VTESVAVGHPANVETCSALRLRAPVVEVPLRVEGLYDAHFERVWRQLRRLGVPQASLDDAVQDVFLVAHRRLADFEGRSSPRTWLAGIAIRIAKDYRRRLSRKGALDGLSADIPDPAPGPVDLASRSEAARLVDRILRGMDDIKREVFVLAEIEQFTMPEIAEVLGINVNTAYSRLRLARAQFEEAVAKLAESPS
jgi:RNA polymerase sigma-70 factor (ECF subfamily)